MQKSNNFVKRSEIIVLIEELKHMREELKYMHEESEKRWTEHKIEHEKLIKQFNKSLSKLGARIGIKFEGISREFIRLYLRRNGINKNKIRKFSHFDAKGEVFGHPSDIEIDVFIKEPLVIGEVKSIIESADDIYILKKKVEYIEKLFNSKAKLIFIAAIDVDELKKKDINNACQLTNIELITS